MRNYDKKNFTSIPIPKINNGKYRMNNWDDVIAVVNIVRLRAEVQARELGAAVRHFEKMRNDRFPFPGEKSVRESLGR